MAHTGTVFVTYVLIGLLFVVSVEYYNLLVQYVLTTVLVDLYIYVYFTLTQKDNEHTFWSKG